jgi:hypothetical protein
MFTNDAAETIALAPLPAPRVELHARLASFVERAWRRASTTPAQRRASLEHIAAWIDERRAANHPAALLFICTHNSRRSHMGQLWAATAAAYFGVEGVPTFSGGTHTTAFDPRAVAALERAGFEIEQPGDTDNPHYAVTFAPRGPVHEAWSKVFDDEANPAQGFAAIMTCSSADEACPTVRGAELRISVPYEDPKLADGTPAQSSVYDERAAQIAAEMFYLFSRVEAPVGAAWPRRRESGPAA